jgi:hypothetical protein
MGLTGGGVLLPYTNNDQTTLMLHPNQKLLPCITNNYVGVASYVHKNIKVVSQNYTLHQSAFVREHVH